MKYELKPYVMYPIIDNGSVAPKGSHPQFVVVSNAMTSELNPFHPLILGYVLHDKQKEDMLLFEQKISIVLLQCYDTFRKEPQIVYNHIKRQR